MHSKLRQLAAFGVGVPFILCLITALSALPALAGVNRWTAIGPDGANVVALVIDPHTPSTAFAGTLGSGVLKTTDGGVTWATANGALPTVNVPALAIDPSKPTTLYAGTDAGVFKSVDGGQMWIAASGGLIGAPQVTVSALAIDPVSPNTLYAATSLGVFKSSDGATNWNSINAGLLGLTPRVIAIDPTSPSTIYVSVDDYEKDVGYGVFRSADAGTTWARIYRTQPYGDGGAPAIVAIVIDPPRLYLALTFDKVVKSLDGGTSWVNVVNGLATDLWSLAIDPTSPTTLYAGTYSGAVFQTTDGGAHWASVTGGPLTTASMNVIALATSAPATIYAGSGTGIFRSSDSAQTWVHLTLGVRNIGTFPLAVDPTTSSTIYTASNGGSIKRTTDGGVHWADLANGPALGWVNFFAFDPVSPSAIYVGGYSGSDDGAALYKSVDGGAHWAAASPMPTSVIDLLAIAPSLSSTLYAGVINFSGVWKSVDGGASWAKVNSGLTAVGPYVSALAVDPTNADNVYVATSPTGRPDTDAKIFKSTDGAARWRQVPIAVPTSAVIRSLAIDPAAPSTLYAAYAYGIASEGGVFKSVDGGETWAIAQNGMSDTAWVAALAIDPSSPARIYAATQHGVFRSTDGAANWTPLNSGLPDSDVWYLSVDRTGSLLRATTPAGLFELRVPGPQSPGTVALIEYVHAVFGDYFITSIPNEISKLDSGAFAGWERTGFQFNAYAAPNANSASVCRFLSTAFAQKSTHFYTPFAPECSALRTNPKWLLESATAFAIAVPKADGSCTAGLIPVYRFFNNGRGEVPHHRYTTDPIVREQMIAQGWVPEGLGANNVQMCSPP